EGYPLGGRNHPEQRPALVLAPSGRMLVPGKRLRALAAMDARRRISRQSGLPLRSQGQVPQTCLARSSRLHSVTFLDLQIWILYLVYPGFFRGDRSTDRWLAAALPVRSAASTRGQSRRP